MLDLCVWIVRGRRYLEAFSLRREEANDKLGTLAGDCFHDGQQPHPSLSTVVYDEMSTLLDDMRVSDHITEPVLEIVRRMLRPEPKQRPTAPAVLADVESAIKVAKEQCNDWYARPRTRSGSGPRRNSAFESIRKQNQEGAHLLQSPVLPSSAATTPFPSLGADLFSKQPSIPFLGVTSLVASLDWVYLWTTTSTRTLSQILIRSNLLS